jgi:hypothetical protein
MTTKPRITIICADCGSSDVTRDATASWSNELQDWELCSVMDQGYCNECDTESALDEVPLDEEAAT